MPDEHRSPKDIHSGYKAYVVLTLPEHVGTPRVGSGQDRGGSREHAAFSFVQTVH